MVKEIVHYCCGSYQIGDLGGVARYDYHIALAFPQRVFFKGPEQRQQMLDFLSTCEDPLIITDNHLSCDIPNNYNIILVQQGVAKTHAIREPEWDEYWKNLCCSGQERMLLYRDPKTTKILTPSTFVVDEFTKYYGDEYTKFNRYFLSHSSELDESRYKTEWNEKPVVLGNWVSNAKGASIVNHLSGKSEFLFKKLQVHPENNSVDDFNRRKQDIYLSSDIFLQLSISEGNAYATLDALLCGVPIVASNVGFFYKDVPEDCFVKIEWEKNTDIEYVEDRLRQAWENKEILSKNAREWYMDNIRFEDWINKTRNFIQQGDLNGI